jgi:DNA-binding transcriptional LysR family regulator
LHAPFLSAERILATSDLISVLPQRVARELVAYRSLEIRQLPHSSPRIATSMIWPRWLDSQPAHRWLRQNIELAAINLRAS